MVNWQTMIWISHCIGHRPTQKAVANSILTRCVCAGAFEPAGFLLLVELNSTQRYHFEHIEKSGNTIPLLTELSSLGERFID